MVNVPGVDVLFKKVKIFFFFWMCVCVWGGGKLGGLRGGALPFPLDEALKCGCVCDRGNEKISIETTIILCLCVRELGLCPWIAE